MSIDATYADWLMGLALEQAQLAWDLDEVPIGAVVARGDEILAACHNRRILDSDPTAHAELLAIRAAAEVVGDWRLTGCSLAVTLEPCIMCAGAIVLSRLDAVVYGAADPKAGAVDTLYDVLRDERLNHSPEILAGVRGEACGQILTDFFRAQRAKGKK
jgi:tRNA(adenine34) deaminase